MITEVIKHIGLYFFYAIADEQIAMSAASRASLLYQQNLTSLSQSEEKNIPLMIQLCEQVVRSFKAKTSNKSRSHETQNLGHFHWPSNVDPSPWRELRTKISLEELSCVIWSSILGYSDTEIAEGLGLTEGTIRYRVGHGLSVLGSLNRLSR